MTSSIDIKFDLDTLFLYLLHATLYIPEKYKNVVYNDMAFKLIEWDNVNRDDLRKILSEHNIKYKELCCECNKELPEENEYQGDPLCDRCILLH